MKKMMVITLLISLVQVGYAQEEIALNKFILGGSINFSIQNNTYPLSSLSINSGFGGIYSNNINDTKNSTFAFSPYVGKEINAHLLVGLQFDYRKRKYEEENSFGFGQPNTVDFVRQSNQFGIGLFSRYTLNPNHLFNFYLQPYFEYNILNEKRSQDANITQEEKASFIELGVGMGVLYNINNRMRTTLRIGGLNYVSGKWEIVNTVTEKDFSSFGMNINLATIFFGFEMKL